jgi:hypothetical protein
MSTLMCGEETIGQIGVNVHAPFIFPGRRARSFNEQIGKRGHRGYRESRG